VGGCDLHTLDPVDRRCTLDLVGVLEAALVDVGLDVGQAELLNDDVYRLRRFELLAGEDVGPDIAVLREGVDCNVALGDDHEPGDTPVFGLLTHVELDVGDGDLGHVDFAREPVQE